MLRIIEKIKNKNTKKKIKKIQKYKKIKTNIKNIKNIQKNEYSRHNVSALQTCRSLYCEQMKLEPNLHVEFCNKRILYFDQTNTPVSIR